jgi:riboflavin kinase/FMN adenylyltransferase
MLVIHFDAEVAGLTAEDWIVKGLAGHLGAAGVVTGEDFTFGKARSGNPDVLREIGAGHGIRTRAVGAVQSEGDVVSSSRIRDALKVGDCETAARLLTRPFAIRGVVQHGDKLGRTIDFPTANLDIGTYLRPRYGIYAIMGRLPDGRVVQGAANLGIRPTFDPPKELLEPHFFDFSGDLYGQEIEVAFHHFLRPEAKFDSLDALVDQMKRDCVEARRLLAQ